MRDVDRAIDAVWRIESARLIAGLTRIVRDVGLAEDLAQDALVAALEQWPKEGVPDNPGAWLMAAAKRRAIDLLRRSECSSESIEELGRELESRADRSAGRRRLATEQDDRRRPAAPRLHLLPPGPVHRGPRRPDAAPARRPHDRRDRPRLPRSRSHDRPAHRPRQAHPRREARPVRGAPRERARRRLASVLEVIYLIFNEGYSATAGDDWMRPGLCEDALRLGRILAELVRDEPEVHGLVALMEIQASRIPRPHRPPGEPILLLEQDRAAGISC